MNKEIEEAKSNLFEIVELLKDEIENNDINATAILDINDLKSLKLLLENSIPKQVIEEKVAEVIRLIESEQFKLIMGDTTVCNRIKYILKEKLLGGKSNER